MSTGYNNVLVQSSEIDKKKNIHISISVTEHQKAKCNHRALHKTIYQAHLVGYVRI